MHNVIDLESRCEAIQGLILPEETRALAERVHLWRLFGSNPTASAAQVLRDLNLTYIPDVSDEWCSPGVTLQRDGGDCDDHAILVVSLLLKLGVEAWVVLGSVPGGYHAWVIGINPVGGLFTMEPQGGKVWWNQFGPNYEPEFILGLDGCWRWARWRSWRLGR